MRLVHYATGVSWAIKPFLSLGSLYLVYLLAVVAVAVGWGLKQGIIVPVLAFLAVNFFVSPVFTFSIDEFGDVLTLGIFLGLAILTSQPMARLRQEAEDARRGHQITATMYELSQLINRQHNLPYLLQVATPQL